MQAPSADNQINVRYLLSWVFALLVFGAGFYGLVLYEFALDDLTKGALISLMTLAAQFVFGEALGSAVGRRSQQAFESGMRQNTPTAASFVCDFHGLTFATREEYDAHVATHGKPEGQG